MARPRFQQHPITPRIWGTVRNAMLNCVNVDSAPKRLVQPLLLSTLHNLIHREVWRFWMLAMKQRSGDPNFVRDLKFSFDCCLCHDDPHALDSKIPCSLELSITSSAEPGAWLPTQAQRLFTTPLEPTIYRDMHGRGAPGRGPGGQWLESIHADHSFLSQIHALRCVLNCGLYFSFYGQCGQHLWICLEV